MFHGSRTKPSAKLDLPLRLALSHRRKARSLAAQCERAYAAGSLPETRHKTLHHLYSEQLALAESTVARIREEQRAQVGDLDRRLRRLQLEQAQLSRQLMTGGLPPRRANIQNRRLVGAAHDIEAVIENRRRILAADDPDDLGGFIDLPLEEYLKPLPYTSAKPSAPEQVTAFVVVLVAGFAVFLPWAYDGDRALSLLELGPRLSEVSLARSLPDLLFRILWVLYLLAPLAAFPLASLHHRRGSGWGVMSVGGLVLLAGLLPPVLLAPTLAEPPAGLTDTVRLGSLLYAAGGVALIVLGARRLAPGATPIRSSLRTALGFGGSLLVIYALVTAALVALPSTPRLQCGVAMTGPANGFVRISCKNAGDGAAYLLIPSRPNQEMEPAVSRRSPASVYGFDIEIREPGSSAFRLLPVSEGMWQARGVPVRGADPIQLDAGLTINIDFDLHALQQAGYDARALRIRVTRGDQRPVLEHERELHPLARL
ncbi:MAG: hypothetical protein GY851_25125 [bacterium]|nr:hypothetical protein [bacterium]